MYILDNFQEHEYKEQLSKQYKTTLHLSGVSRNSEMVQNQKGINPNQLKNKGCSDS